MCSCKRCANVERKTEIYFSKSMGPPGSSDNPKNWNMGVDAAQTKIRRLTATNIEITEE
jgi:hypothetical protein